MDRKLPPLNAVKVFDAVVRNGSLSAAARALQISQSAVSKHIRNLEDFLDCTLLIRTQSGIGLTPAGQRFHEGTNPALTDIERATMACRAATHGVSVLKISAPASLAVRWMASRLTDFQRDHPGIVVDLTISDTCPDFAMTGHDGALVPMRSEKTPHEWQRLFDEVVVPVYSPKLADALPIRDPQAILDLPLIHTTTRTELWPNWMIGHGVVERKRDKSEPGFGFQDFYLSIASAIAGLGVALVPRFLVVEDIEGGLLITPPACSLETGHAYWLATRTGTGQKDDLEVFCTWLVNELTGDSV